MCWEEVGRRLGKSLDKKGGFGLAFKSTRWGDKWRRMSGFSRPGDHRFVELSAWLVVWLSPTGFSSLLEKDNLADSVAVWPADAVREEWNQECNNTNMIKQLLGWIGKSLKGKDVTYWKMREEFSSKWWEAQRTATGINEWLKLCGIAGD